MKTYDAYIIHQVGGWGWVDDCDRKQPRHEIGSWR